MNKVINRYIKSKQTNNTLLSKKTIPGYTKNCIGKKSNHGLYASAVNHVFIATIM